MTKTKLVNDKNDNLASRHDDFIKNFSMNSGTELHLEIYGTFATQCDA